MAAKKMKEIRKQNGDERMTDKQWLEVRKIIGNLMRIIFDTGDEDAIKKAIDLLATFKS